MQTRTVAVAAALALVLAACASSEPTASPPEELTERSDGDPGSDGKDDKGGKTDEKSRKQGKKGERGSGGSNASGGDPGGGDDGGEQGSSETDEGFTEGSAEDDDSSASFPAAGDYVYSQRGYEDFCQATSCDRRQLPPRQIVETSHRSRNGGEAIVVTRTQSSDGNEARTTTRYTRAGALITELHASVTYQGYTFAETYSPRPPIESLRFPLETGASWQGSWRAGTSGDYQIRVGELEAVATGEGEVRAVRVVSTTTLRGDFEGGGTITAWIDPATRAVVKSLGSLTFESRFGTYKTKFDTLLRTGPAYR